MGRRLFPTAVAGVAAAVAVTLAGGCGGGSSSAKTTSTGTSSAPPPVVGALKPVTYPSAGLSFAAPEGWKTEAGVPPLVATVRQGQAIVAVWRYPRPGEQLPVTHVALVNAKDALVAAIKKRDPTFRLIQAKLLHVGPERAVQVLGVGTVNGQRRTIRSTHIYAQGAEFVFDEYAPPSDFERVDNTVFTPLLLSVKISPPRR